MQTLVILLVLIGLGYYFYEEKGRDLLFPQSQMATTTPESDNSSDPELASSAQVIGLGQSLTFRGVTVTPLRVVEDSRCGVDVQCIQAGTVRVETRLVSGMGTSTMTIPLGQSVTTEAEAITLVSVQPQARSTVQIAPADYRFEFKIDERPQLQ